MKDHVNMFGGSPLNRLSWLRSSPSFLNGLIGSPKTRFLLFNAGQPLLLTKAPDFAQNAGTLAFLSVNQVKPFLGQEPYFNQAKTPGELISKEEETSFTEAARHRGLPLVFLGLHEPQSDHGHGALPSSEFSSKSTDAANVIAKIEGTPYFSFDVADLELSEEEMTRILTETGATNDEQKLIWSDARAVMSTMSSFEGAVYAEARSMVDWNWRNKFCPGCGSPQYSLWGGWKITCSSLLPWADNSNRKRPCPSGKGLQNYAHPRTDGVVIMCTVDRSGDKILLGRSRKFPFKFFSALAGFIEPGETFEDAVSRELWEEAGIQIYPNSVVYHSGQPWPYPANLMCGFYARADERKEVRVDLDNELVEAKWYTREDVLEILNWGKEGEGTKIEWKKVSEAEKKAEDEQQKVMAQARARAQAQGQGEGKKEGEILSVWTENKDHQDVVEDKEKGKEKGKGKDEPPFRIPPTTAIAGVLIRDWAVGKVKFEPIEGDGEELVAKISNL
ncbi:hypothetical protein D9758_005902 [Tetrapyrgos nigripes]|uniref:NAD(+) diphosphatase n=1 Tax=Tetrapyrgos nigripes TaxID=182062 RepID=A0A8H5LHJ3_9AGAR|nr:hypothetical protein D9758_005902 [Tetrapyrgos nigripes]